MMSTNVGVDTATAAARRRQRRLRSWLRHERMTVAMTLAEKLHHTSRGQKLARVGEEVVHDALDALRGLKTPPPGVRPGSLSDPGPQRSDRTVRRSSGEVPLLAVPVLAGGDGVDGTALSFLVRRAVEDRKREKEEKARKKEAQEKADLELAKRDPWWAQHLADTQAMEQRYGNPSSASSSKRKRKKRRKRKLPKSSSGVRIRRCGQGFRSRALLFSGAQCSLLLTTGPRCSTSWPVRNRSTVNVLLMCKVGFPGYFAPRAVFPSLSSGPRCSALWPVWTRRIFSACARLGLLVFDDVPRAVLLLVVSGPNMPVIMAGMDHGTVMWRFTGAVLGRGCRARCVQRHTLGPAVHHFGGAAGAAHHQGHLHPCRDAEFDPHGSDCSADH